MIDKSVIIVIAKLRDRLNKRGFVRSATDINEILYKLIEERYVLEPEEQVEDEASDAFVASNIVGLRGDVQPETPWGGWTVNPFFFDSGEPN